MVLLDERPDKIANSLDNLNWSGVVTIRSEIGMAASVEHYATIGIVDRMVRRKVSDRARTKASKGPIELFRSSTYIRQPLASGLQDTVLGSDLPPNIFE